MFGKADSRAAHYREFSASDLTTVYLVDMKACLTQLSALASVPLAAIHGLMAVERTAAVAALCVKSFILNWSWGGKCVNWRFGVWKRITYMRSSGKPSGSTL